jgi:hypothetical protein
MIFCTDAVDSHKLCTGSSILGRTSCVLQFFTIQQIILPTLIVHVAATSVQSCKWNRSLVRYLHLTMYWEFDLMRICWCVTDVPQFANSGMHNFNAVHVPLT